MAERTTYIIDLTDKVTGKLKGVQKEAKNTDTSFKSINNSLKGMSGTLTGIFGVGTLIAFGSQIIQTTAKFQSLSNSIKFASDTSQQGQLSMQWLSNIAKAYGLPIMELTEGFKTFQGAMMKTRFTAHEVRTMFAQVSTGVTAMGLSADDAKGTFLALGQIMGKGKVQAEELRGQIGERIPGAFAIAARAMNMSTSELDKFMADGKLLAEDFLPKFAAEMEKTFGEGAIMNANSLQSTLTRASSAWTELMLAMGNSDSNGLVGHFLNSWSVLLDDIADKFKNIQQLSAASTGGRTISVLGDIEGKLQKEAARMKESGSSKEDIEKYISGQVAAYRFRFESSNSAALDKIADIEKRNNIDPKNEGKNAFSRWGSGSDFFSIPKTKKDLYEDETLGYKAAVDRKTQSEALLNAIQPLSDKIVSALYMPKNVIAGKAAKTKKQGLDGLTLNESRNGATHITFNIDTFQKNEFSKDGTNINNSMVKNFLDQMALGLQTVLNDSQIAAKI